MAVTLIYSAERGLVGARFGIDPKFHQEMAAERPYLQYVAEKFGPWIATELTGRTMWRVLTGEGSK